MTNPYDPQNPGSRRDDTPRSGDGGVDYGSYQYPVGGHGTGTGGDTGASYQSGHQGSYPQAPYDPHLQASYGGAGTWGTVEEKNGVAPWALAVAILGLLVGLTIVGAIISFIPGLIGLILGIIGVFRARGIRGPRRRMGISIAAVVISILAILMTVALIAFAFFLADSGAIDCFTLPTAEQQQACLDQWARNSLS